MAVARLQCGGCEPALGQGCAIVCLTGTLGREGHRLAVDAQRSCIGGHRLVTACIGQNVSVSVVLVVAGVVVRHARGSGGNGQLIVRRRDGENLAIAARICGQRCAVTSHRVGLILVVLGIISPRMGG